MLIIVLEYSQIFCWQLKSQQFGSLAKVFGKRRSNDEGFPILMVIGDLQFRGVQVHLSRHKLHALHLLVQVRGLSEERPTKLVVSQHRRPQPVSQVHSHLVLETCAGQQRAGNKWSSTRTVTSYIVYRSDSPLSISSNARLTCKRLHLQQAALVPRATVEDPVLCAGQLDTTGEGTPYPILGVERRSGVNLYYITVIHVGIGWPRTQVTFCLTAAIETKCRGGGGGGGGGGEDVWVQGCELSTGSYFRDLLLLVCSQHNLWLVNHMVNRMVITVNKSIYPTHVHVSHTYPVHLVLAMLSGSDILGSQGNLYRPCTKTQ